jgi:hypothetical protein
MKQQEPSLAELYFEQFRKEFPHTTTSVWVNGDTMIFRYMSKIVARGSAEYARQIIEHSYLPLRVELEFEKKVHSLPHLLKIIFDEQLIRN